MARLKGARLVTAPEPEKGLELNIALLKQLTGGDRYTARHLNANMFEFKPEFKLLFTTNHLPRTADDTVFASGRVKLIPFERHFSENEQDRNLKRVFRKSASRSHILNWLIAGLRHIREAGNNAPPRVLAAIEAYRSEADIIGMFLSEFTIAEENSRLSTSLLYTHYAKWAKDNGYSAINGTHFGIEMRRRFEIRRTGKVGNMIVGLSLAPDINPQK
jgi:putative DNA primase/helicase